MLEQVVDVVPRPAALRKRRSARRGTRRSSALWPSEIGPPPLHELVVEEEACELFAAHVCWVGSSQPMTRGR